MPGTLNHTDLKQYASDFAAQVLEGHIANQSTFSGQDLLTLTPLRQVNLGIVNQIFEQWRADAEAFRSPYFDFGNEGVKKALQEFMNTVSRHISLRPDELRPMLVDATEDALRLLLAPEDYFEQELRAMPDFTFTTEKARELTKYTHIHAGVAKALMLRLTDSGTEFVYVNQALNWLAEIVNGGTSLDAIAPYVAQFSAVKPLDLHKLTDGKYSEEEEVETETVDMEEATTQIPANESFFDTALTEETPAPAPRVEPVVEFAQVNITRESAMSAPATSTGDSSGVYSRTDSINNRFKVDLPAPARESAYGNVSMKVDKIMGSIALGQRFMFVNQLFDKNSNAFDEAIRRLDRAENLEDARKYLLEELAPEYKWDTKSAVVADLMTIVQRKFK